MGNGMVIMRETTVAGKVEGGFYVIPDADQGQ